MRFAIPLLLGLSSPALGADAQKPHLHQGILDKYTGRPTVPELSENDLEKLAAGKAVLKQERGDSGGRGIAVQHVHASPEVIWSRILAFEHYIDWVDNVKTCEVTSRTGTDIDVHFVIGAAMFSAEYWIVHDAHPSENWMTWHLDYRKENDLDDSVGFWVVEPLADEPGWSRLYYSVDVKVGGWVPGFVENMVAKSGLTKATEWVKRESEAKARGAD